MDRGRSIDRQAPRAAVVLLALFAVSLWSPTASIAQTQALETVTVPSDVEAWYYVTDDSIAPLPPGIPPPDPFNPYGENTLHTSITGGQEETRTYITLDTTTLPVTFELVEAILTLPIDPEGVTMNPDTARVQICLSQPPPESVEGSFEEPPEVDCETKAPATYEEEPFPHLLADITDFETELTFSGLAVLPSGRAKEQSDTWHVTFYGKKSEAEGARPITAELSILPDEPVLDFDPTDDDGAPFVPEDSGSGSTGDFEFDTGSAPPVDFGSEPVDEGPALDEPVAVASPLEAPEELELAADEEARPNYTVLWALPLLLLAFVTYFSSALTREIVLRRGS